jgi:pimeloyl-ACP methyl ester carboxylesterase
MAKLDRNGVAIHYEVHGSGPTILLSHGYSSTSRMWDGQVAALKDRYQVVVWDSAVMANRTIRRTPRNIPRR